MKPTCWTRAGLVSVYFLASLAAASGASPTTPTFFARRDYTGLDSTFAQVADTNGDGIPDLISSEDGHITVLFGNRRRHVSHGSLQLRRRLFFFVRRA